MTKEAQVSRGKPKTPRTRKCLNCRQYFKPLQQGATTCSVECAILHTRSNVTKQKKREHAQAKKHHNNNDKAYLTKKAQQVFNQYIRERDKKEPCISCGHTGDRQRHAGHFMPVGSNGHIRFDEANCHSQCSVCNNHLSGNLAEYERNLILKIGIEEVNRLKTKFTKSYDTDELKSIITTYKSKVKELNA